MFNAFFVTLTYEVDFNIDNVRKSRFNNSVDGTGKVALHLTREKLYNFLSIILTHFT